MYQLNIKMYAERVHSGKGKGFLIYIQDVCQSTSPPEHEQISSAPVNGTQAEERQ